MRNVELSLWQAESAASVRSSYRARYSSVLLGIFFVVAYGGIFMTLMFSVPHIPS